MSYAAAIDELNAMAPELFTKPGQSRRKFSLDEIRTLLSGLGNPQSRFRSVLIAGTNGKGSTAATLASILGESGLRVGLYTSPHLERVNERIRLNGVEISDAEFAHAFFTVQDEARVQLHEGKLPQMPSFFEFLTALAFVYFAKTGIDVAVLEVGMGGRLDATNIVEPLLSIVTDISLDHTEWLGSTIAEITREKAGILRPAGTLVTLPQHPEANQVLGEVATRLEVRGVNAAAYMPAIEVGGEPYSIDVFGKGIEVASPLRGAHQHRNVGLAIAAAVELVERHQFPVTAEAISAGVRNTRWPGRLEKISWDGRDWILDVAHNPAGAWALRAGLRSILGDDADSVDSPTLIFSCLRDKPVTEMAQILFPLFGQVVLAPIRSARAARMEELVGAAEATGTPSLVAESILHALELARERGGLIVVSGSVYLVGDARSLLLARATVQS
jgi:dihydrofolate synthase/folylpolyglutamate synthase